MPPYVTASANRSWWKSSCKACLLGWLVAFLRRFHSLPAVDSDPFDPKTRA